METKTSLVEGIRKEFDARSPARQANVIKALPKAEQIYLLHNVLIPGKYYPCILLLDEELLLDEIMAKGGNLAEAYVTKSVHPPHLKLVEKALKDHKFAKSLWKHLDEKRLIAHVKAELGNLPEFWENWGSIYKSVALDTSLPGNGKRRDAAYRSMNKFIKNKAFDWLHDVMFGLDQHQCVDLWCGLALTEMKKLMGVCAYFAHPDPHVPGTYTENLAFGVDIKESLSNEWSGISRMDMPRITEFLEFAREVQYLDKFLTRSMSLDQLTQLHQAGFKDYLTDRQRFEVEMNGKQSKKLGSLSKAKAFVREGRELPADISTEVRRLSLGRRLQLLAEMQ